MFCRRSWCGPCRGLTFLDRFTLGGHHRCMWKGLEFSARMGYESKMHKVVARVGLLALAMSAPSEANAESCGNFSEELELELESVVRIDDGEADAGEVERWSKDALAIVGSEGDGVFDFEEGTLRLEWILSSGDTLRFELEADR